MSVEKERLILAEYRIKEADQKLNGAKILLENGCLKDSINRSYYAIFNALRSVLALEGVDFKRHSQVIGYFNKNYIHKKIIDEKYIDTISMAFQIRNSCDYDDFYIVSKQDAENQLENAENFLEAIKVYLQEKGTPL